MKIVCDACQAKYSIADEKVQGKAFKIRCKKCGHIIVVRQSADKPATAESKPAPAAEQQGVWYIVVEGEQVGPLAEADIAGRLSRGEINPDTLIWKDGLADWVKISTVPELNSAAAAQPATAPAEPPAEPTPPPAAPIPARRRSSARMQVAREPARAPAEDVFAKPAAVAPGAADLFAPSVAMPSPVSEPAAAPFAFGAAAAPAPEPVTQQAPSNNGAGGSHLTGQRNENSVLFSLSNLEALAVPSGSTSARPPSTSSTTEGSGLIDIRSMAARTIGQTNRSDSPGAVDSLPTFSTPQFSPVAPVLLPMAPSGPPKWVYPVLGVLGLGIVALGFGIYKVVSAPQPAPPPQIVVPAPAAPVAAPAPAAAPAAPAAPAAAAPEPAKPAAPDEKAGEDKSASDKKKPSGKGSKTASKGSGEGSAKQASDTTKKGASPEPAPTPTVAAPPKPAGKKSGSIEDLLDQVGTKKPTAEAKPAKAPSAAPLPSLTQSDIVNAMKGVQPRVKECFNQYKQAGIANVSISVAKGGRVASATVSGKFAGTPSGSCVEAAAKTAKFPPCESMSFPWPFQLR